MNGHDPQAGAATQRERQDSTELGQHHLHPIRPARINHKRPIVIGHCPRCAGTGVEDYREDTAEARSCSRCEGEGDLDAYRLTGAWQQGYEAGVEWARLALHQALGCVQQGCEWTEEAPIAPPAKVIRSRLGG
jgi:hypothetical protein